MRKVDKKTFLSLPRGTFFYKKIKGEPEALIFDSLCIKDESIGDVDYYYFDLSNPEISFEYNDDFIDVWLDHLSKGDDIIADYRNIDRDGLYEEDDEFFVLDEGDVKSLLGVINEFIKP